MKATPYPTGIALRSTIPRLRWAPARIWYLARTTPMYAANTVMPL